MMRQYELVERVKSYDPSADEDLLDRAYVYAMRAHGSQVRASGDPYFTHPLEVAAILTDMRLDDATIVAAVLHDVIEDTEATREEIDRLFGPEIGALVEGLTKIKRLDLVSKRATQAENLRKLLLAISKDVRVLLVKLADRLHNMRTLGFVPEEKRARIAEETLDIYAPLAGRMGIQEMRDELEDLAFRALNPDAHASIVHRLAEIEGRSGGLIAGIESDLSCELNARGIGAKVKGRRKHIYSIWHKMERKTLALEQLSDIFGFRVIVETPEDCYRTLGAVHLRWATVPGRFKDYISTPKQNDYRSLHTTIVGPGRQRVELQIRTSDMDRVAELGVAAHALYKDGVGRAALASETGAYQWLRRTVATLSEGASPEEFLENTKLELFHDQVFCFTPKGRLIALPRGATPIDFAYAVHTDVGNGAVGCKVNGRVAPLVSELANGDEVEIVRAEGQSPPPAWEAMVRTGKARAAIRRATRSAARRQYAGLGRRIVERAFARAGRPYADDRVKEVLPRLARTSVEDVLAAVGRGEMFSGDVVRAAYPDFREERAPGPEAAKGEGGWFELKGAGGLVFRAAEEAGAVAIPHAGLDEDLPVRFGPGGAVPGDRIVGVMTPGEGVVVHPIDSPALAELEEAGSWLDVRWDVEGTRRRRFPARLRVTVLNEPGALAEVARIISEHDGNVDAIAMAGLSRDVREMVLDVEVWDLKHLNAILSRLRGREIVSSAERVLGGEVAAPATAPSGPRRNGHGSAA